MYCFDKEIDFSNDCLVKKEVSGFRSRWDFIKPYDHW